MISLFKQGDQVIGFSTDGNGDIIAKAGIVVEVLKERYLVPVKYQVLFEKELDWYYEEEIISLKEYLER